jgi:hypothetical protein
MALCIIQGKVFFGNEVLEQGKVLFVNLDEDQDKQVRLYYRMTKGEKVPGYLISRARSCRLPEQIKMLEEDIKTCRPLVVSIDPLQRIMGGKKVNEQSDVGPIIDELKRLSKEYSCTIIVNHHSTKSKERDKESTSSWLSGSNDLDAAWDFCLCIEYNPKFEAVHLRNFQKEKAKTDIYYEAEVINKDEIIDLHHVPEELGESKQARILLLCVQQNPGKSFQWLSEKTGIKLSSIYYQVKKFQLLKNATVKTTQHIDNKEVKTYSESLAKSL